MEHPRTKHCSIKHSVSVTAHLWQRLCFHSRLEIYILKDYWCDFSYDAHLSYLLLLTWWKIVQGFTVHVRVHKQGQRCCGHLKASVWIKGNSKWWYGAASHGLLSILTGTVQDRIQIKMSDRVNMKQQREQLELIESHSQIFNLSKLRRIECEGDWNGVLQVRLDNSAFLGPLINVWFYHWWPKDSEITLGQVPVHPIKSMFVR